MEAHKVSMKTLFKKILPSKKASENPVLRRKKIPRQPPTLGIKPFHVDNNKTIIISVKGTPIFLKALDLFL